MRTKFISAISAIALAAVGVGYAQAQDSSAETSVETSVETDGQNANTGNVDALMREEVQLVRDHCAALLAENGNGIGTAVGDGAAANDASQPGPSATDSLAHNPMTESEMNDPTGTAAHMEDTHGTAHGAAAESDVASNGASAETSAEGQTSADAEIIGNAAVPAGSDTQPFDLSMVTVEDCIEAGIVG